MGKELNSNFDVDVMDGESLVSNLPVVEDVDTHTFLVDLSVVPTKYDVIVVVTASYGEGDPPKNFARLFLALLTCAAHGHRPLHGLQHAVLGQGSSVYEQTFQNVPRLTDRYFGECGSRRFLMRQEIDAADYLEGDQDQKDRASFREALFKALQSGLSVNAPPVCSWEEARASHKFPIANVVPRTPADLEKSFNVGTAGKHDDQAIGTGVWVLIIAAALLYASSG